MKCCARKPVVAGIAMLFLATRERPSDWRTSFLFEYFNIRNGGDTPTLLGVRTAREEFVT